MEAKDRILSKEMQAEVWLKAEQDAGFLLDCDLEGALADPNLFNGSEQLHSRMIAEAQDKISFKAGIKEAVEWLRTHEHLFPGHLESELDTLNAKLKEWNRKGLT